MKGFRNALVHRYEEIDDNKAFISLKTGMGDFNIFISEIEKFLEKHKNKEIPSNLTLRSGISNRHSRTKSKTINRNVYKGKQNGFIDNSGNQHINSQNSLMNNSEKRIPINRIVHNKKKIKVDNRKTGGNKKSKINDENRKMRRDGKKGNRSKLD